MMRRVFYLLMYCVLPIITHDANALHDIAPNNVLHIGILAYRGNEVTLKRWILTATYLNKQLPYTFKIVPVSNDNIESLVKDGHIDFVLTNPASYTVLETKYGVRRLATLLNAVNGGSYTMFGAVIFTRSDRPDIENLQDLHGKSFMAVHQNAFGGWWMAKRELLLAGLKPKLDFSSMTFANFPQDKIVYAVQNGIVDAGTVRTSVLERMSKAGHIKLDEFKILNPQYNFNFSLRNSTRLYPEWPFAATRKVSQTLAQDVALALLNMPGNSKPAKVAMIKGWTLPLDYQPVHELMQELHIGPYENLDRVTFGNITNKYGYWILGMVSLFLILMTVSSYIFGMNRRYVYANKILEREIIVREELEEQLKYQAMHDDLTGLPNRVLLLDRVRQAIFLNERERTTFSLAVIDLDNFKAINDKFGHEFGDKILKQVAVHFEETVRKTDTITRFGGDEFILLIDSSADTPAAIAITEKILTSLQEPFSVRGAEFRITASIGIASYPEHGHSIETLIRHADLAMYKAKLTGNCVVSYDSVSKVTKHGHKLPEEEAL